VKSILYFQSSLCASNVSELNGVYRFAKDARWSVRVIPYGESSAGREHVVRVPDIPELIDFWNPVGAIVDCGAAPRLIGPDAFPRLPVVFLDYPDGDGICNVTFDARTIAETAARELLSVGCTSFGYVPWSEALPWSVSRGEFFERIIRINGCKCHRFRPRILRHESEQAWLCEWLRSAPAPFGVFAANDYIGSKVISCAVRAGRKVGEDIFVIGVDNDTQICEHSEPTLTSILPDHDLAGYTAARVLCDRIAHPKRQVRPILISPVAVIHRASTHAYRRGDERVQKALEMIRRNACRGLTPGEVVAEMGCSSRLAQLRFREVTGGTIRSAIQSVRFEHAKNLLRSERLSVLDVARQCGYASTEALRKVFLAEGEGPPARWRRKV